MEIPDCIIRPRGPWAVAPVSRGRLFPEPASPTRTDFQRDRDRIIHSTAFRRLKHKTQVFVAHEGDHYRTRLTHSIEVAQIARSLARSLARSIAVMHRGGYAHRDVKPANIVMGPDGARLVAGTFGDQLYVSLDSGLTWTPRESARNWSSVTSSADGARFAAVANNGQIYSSADSGVTWRAHGPTMYWQSLTSSADGTRLAATASGDHIYVSTDSGLTWTSRSSIQWWGPITSSADGTKLVAGPQTGTLLTSVASTSLGIAGSISGDANEAIELQYVGNNTFSVLSYVGSLIVR